MTSSPPTGAALNHSTRINAVPRRSGVGGAVFEELVEECGMLDRSAAILRHLVVGTSTTVFVVRADHDAT